MRARLLPILALVALAVPVATASAKDDGSREFLLTMALNGRYHSETHYTDITTQGFCPGTGQVFDAPFSLIGTSKFSYKLGSKKPLHLSMDVVDNFNQEGWTAEVATVAQGDECSAIQNFKCTGTISQAPGGENFAYAQTLGKKTVIGGEFRGTPAADPNSSTCNLGDYYPGEDPSVLGPALAPYRSAAFVLKTKTLKALKKGHKRTRTFKPVKENLDPDYDVATCNGATACTGALNAFRPQIVIKRLK